MRKTLAFLVLTSVLAAPISAYDVNKDIKNLGPDAEDLAILLSGAENVTQTFNGYSPGHPLGGRFGSVSHGPSPPPSGPNTLIHFQKFSDGTDKKINNGQTIHVGYSTADHSSSILDMWWTDASGNRIPGSVVYNITSKWTYTTARFTLHFLHDFQTGQALSIRNLSVAVLPTALPLADLNRFNERLAAALQTVSPGFTLVPGEQVDVEVPQSVPPGSAVVAVYDFDPADGQGESRDFVQMIAVEDGSVEP